MVPVSVVFYLLAGTQCRCGSSPGTAPGAVYRRPGTPQPGLPRGTTRPAYSDRSTPEGAGRSSPGGPHGRSSASPSSLKGTTWGYTNILVRQIKHK